MDIGSKIKQYRKNEGLTQKDLAAKANISRSYLGDVEKNRYNASVETLQKIANALKIPVTQLLTTEEKLELATGSLNEINKTIELYYASKADENYTNSIALDAETHALLHKFERLSKKDREIVEVLVDQLLKEE